MNYTDRYHQLTAQATYQCEIRACGLSALLAPYTLRSPAIPGQRTKSPALPRTVGVYK